MNKNNLTYREGTLKDTSQLKALGLISYGQYSAILSPENWAKLNNYLLDEDKLTALIKISKCFVCMDNEQLIGMAYIISSGNPWDIFKEEWAYIRMVGVNPRYQGHGIAKTLMNMCLDHARNSNEKTVALHTSEFMDAARHIYESLGFKVLYEIEPRLGKRHWLYTLEII